MKKIFLPVILILIVGCANVQYTNRSALVLLPPDQEMKLGLTAFEEFLKKEKVSADLTSTALLKKVGEKIAAAADQPAYKWEFVLVEGPKTANAFCLPGGKVVFYTGILPVCKDEDGIATVMSHEVSHAIARHGAERISQGMLADLAGNALSIALSSQSSGVQTGVLTGYGLAAQYGVLLPYNRDQEAEADFIGLILMAKAGYDPQKAIDFWIRMRDLKDHGFFPEFMSTHPSDEKRIEEIKKRLPEALVYYKKIW